MKFYYLDSSAWVKRYQSEAGTEWLERLWNQPVHFACATLGLIEVLCTIARRHAAQTVAEAVTTSMLSAVRSDFDTFLGVELDERVLHLAKSLASRRLRGADCIHLASALRVRESSGETVTLIASDAELLAAATAEGLPIIDPSRNPDRLSLD